MSVELYAMGQRASWRGRFVEVEKFLEPQGDGSFTVTWALDLQPCGEEGAAGDAKRRARHQSGRRALTT